MNGSTKIRKMIVSKFSFEDDWQSGINLEGVIEFPSSLDLMQRITFYGSAKFNGQNVTWTQMVCSPDGTFSGAACLGNKIVAVLGLVSFREGTATLNITDRPDPNSFTLYVEYFERD